MSSEYFLSVVETQLSQILQTIFDKNEIKYKSEERGDSRVLLKYLINIMKQKFYVQQKLICLKDFLNAWKHKQGYFYLLLYSFIFSGIYVD